MHPDTCKTPGHLTELAVPVGEAPRQADKHAPAQAGKSITTPKTHPTRR